MSVFGGVYGGRRVLVTGHTGFKGSWLSLWLHELGARVAGIALAPSTTPSHWRLLDLADVDSREIDVRDAAAVRRAIEAIDPDIVFHMAAQALVRRSYREPIETWSTNVMGTANVLEACRHAPGVRAIVVVTTDKCYENREWPWGYRETDPLGGHDPYSASKAGTELVASSYRSAFFAGKALIATARAGNVIGGGDWSEDRLLCDLVRAVAAGTELEIRSPGATRPWQHVLESLSGYLLLGQRLLAGDARVEGAWNIGPEPEANRKVADVLGALRAHWPELSWRVTADPQPHEANLLYLDSAKAKGLLGWQTVWRLDEGLRRTAEWYRAYIGGGAVRSRDQLSAYVGDARALGLAWVGA